MSAVKQGYLSAGRSLIPGAVALSLLILLIGGAVISLVIFDGSVNPLNLLDDPYIRRVTWFTLLQAFLSTGLSALIAIPVARALHRRRFPGRSLLIRIFGICLVLPTIVTILGIIQVHGKNGWVNDLLSLFSLDGGHYLYGLNGILIAHVFFNMPLIARGLLQALESVPMESWRLAAQLDMKPGQIFRLIEWPALRSVLPGLAGLVLMLCFTSFAVVLALGGGPKATTTEVAIYQALRFDFDIPTAVALALIQMILCGSAALILLKTGRPVDSEPALNRPSLRPDRNHMSSRCSDLAALTLAIAWVIPPILAMLIGGFNSQLFDTLPSPALLAALAASLSVAVPAALLAFSLGMAILVSSRYLVLRNPERTSRWMEHAGALILVVPPFVLATGLFILLRPITDVFALGPILVVVINGCMALPFVLRVMGPAYHRLGLEHDRLCKNLGLNGWNRFRWVEWQQMRRPAGLALALSTTLSLGDFGVIALFGSQDFTTLPLFIYRNMGAYRLDQAAVAGLVLIVTCILLFQLIERGLGGRHAED